MLDTRVVNDNILLNDDMLMECQRNTCVANAAGQRYWVVETTAKGTLGKLASRHSYGSANPNEYVPTWNNRNVNESSDSER